MDYEQSYIPHEYVELRMPPGPPDSTGSPTFLMDPNHLHIWPRHSFMLIALPNKDKSFTCTLFAPTADLLRLNTRTEVLSWFKNQFPDAVSLIGEELLLNDFQRNPRSSLISIKARPYHYKDRVVIIGDAAHSMVPFYGQGLNCGLEDVRVLQTVMAAHKVDGQATKNGFHTSDVDSRLQNALDEYSSSRHADLVAISDLCAPADHSSEMRHDVTTPLYRLFKTIDTFLASISSPAPFSSLVQTLATASFAPASSLRGWIPLYTMVTFRPDISYSTARLRAERQARIIKLAVCLVGLGAAALGGMILGDR